MVLTYDWNGQFWSEAVLLKQHVERELEDGGGGGGGTGAGFQHKEMERQTR
jgi:hypothetical protein